MLDPYEFALAVATAVASLTGSDPAPPVEVPTVEVVAESTFRIPSGEHAGTEVIVNPFQLDWDEQVVIEDETLSIGWIVSPVSGRLVCATGAPCEHDPAFSGPEDSTYNWVTGQEN